MKVASLILLPMSSTHSLEGNQFVLLHWFSNPWIQQRDERGTEPVRFPETTTQSIIISSIIKEGIKSSIITSEHANLCTVMLVPTQTHSSKVGVGSDSDTTQGGAGTEAEIRDFTLLTQRNSPGNLLY